MPGSHMTIAVGRMVVAGALDREVMVRPAVVIVMQWRVGRHRMRDVRRAGDQNERHRDQRESAGAKTGRGARKRSHRHL